MDIKQLVKEFNSTYFKMMKEIESELRDDGYSDIDDISDREYEEAVGDLALDLAGGDVTIAVEILNHPDVEGGWMAGDPIKYVKHVGRK